MLYITFAITQFILAAKQLAKKFIFEVPLLSILGGPCLTVALYKTFAWWFSYFP